MEEGEGQLNNLNNLEKNLLNNNDGTDGDTKNWKINLIFQINSI